MDSRLPGSSVHGDSPGKNTGVGCHQEVFNNWFDEDANDGKDVSLGLH